MKLHSPFSAQLVVAIVVACMTSRHVAQSRTHTGHQQRNLLANAAPEHACGDHSSPVLSHHAHDHRDSHAAHEHCACVSAYPLCIGSKCTTGHQHCDMGVCTPVHGYVASCTDCQCISNQQSHQTRDHSTSLNSSHNAQYMAENVVASLTGLPGQVVIIFDIRGISPTPEPLPMVEYAFRPLPDSSTEANVYSDDTSAFSPSGSVKATLRRHTADGWTTWQAVVSKGSEGDGDGAIESSTGASFLLVYRINNDNTKSQVRILAVPSERLVGDDATHFTFGVVGDIGLSYSAPAVSQALKQDKSLGMLLHPGDVSYAFKPDELRLYVSRLEGLISRVPYLVCLGNHEANNADVLRTFFERFPLELLANQSGSANPRWFSVTVSSVHIAVLDTESSLDATSAQRRWLEADLERAAALRKRDCQDVRWLVVMMHYPMYSSFRRAKNDERKAKVAQMEQLRSNLEDVFVNYGVDLVLSGHDHMYERTAPVFHAQQQPVSRNAPVYLSVGTGGHNIYASWYNKPPYAEYRLARPGYGRMTVFQNGTLTWEFLEVDISPCVLADEGGDSTCPSQQLQKQGYSHIGVVLRDTMTLNRQCQTAPEGTP